MINTFKGRTLAVSSDLTLDERAYLYSKTRELKEAGTNQSLLNKFRINDSNYGVYLVFLENSTRTKESFRNAAAFHNVKVESFDGDASSLNKNESYYNSFKTLAGYDNTCFVVRSKLEGLCRYLENSVGEFSKRMGLSKSSFINAGDGKHEHPTQEELDGFSFLENQNWERNSIHIALIGDLKRGRTAHSKADGLKYFKEVKLDLIAPEAMQMPKNYLQKMEKNGFEIRIFENLKEYYSQTKIAFHQYFTRVQAERYGEFDKKKIPLLREAITLTKDLVLKLPSETKIYHPQPIDKLYPTLPSFLNNTSFNAYDAQFINGYKWRKIFLAAVNGHLGNDFEGESKKEITTNGSFIEERKIIKKDSIEYTQGIIPIHNGVTIDHLYRGEAPQFIENHFPIISQTLGYITPKFTAIDESRKEPGIYKGIYFYPELNELSADQIEMLAAIAPGCTVNYIKNNEVKKKLVLNLPERIRGITNVFCSNESCITHESHKEGITPEFKKVDEKNYSCQYCDTSVPYTAIWKKTW